LNEGVAIPELLTSGERGLVVNVRLLEPYILMAADLTAKELGVPFQAWIVGGLRYLDSDKGRDIDLLLESKHPTPLWEVETIYFDKLNDLLGSASRGT